MTGNDVYSRIKHNLGVMTFEERINKAKGYLNDITDYLIKADLYTENTTKEFLICGACQFFTTDNYLSNFELETFKAIFNKDYSYETVKEIIEEHANKRSYNSFIKQFKSIKSIKIAREILYFLYLFACSDYFVDDDEIAQMEDMCSIFVNNFYGG